MSQSDGVSERAPELSNKTSGQCENALQPTDSPGNEAFISTIESLAPAMNDNLGFVAAWKDFRWRRRWFFSVSLGGFLLLILQSRLSADGEVSRLLGLVWMIGCAIVATRLSLFRCPRCHHRFFRIGLHSNFFARECQYCKLPRLSECGFREMANNP